MSRRIALRATAFGLRRLARLGPFGGAAAAHIAHRLPFTDAGPLRTVALGGTWDLDLRDNLQRTLYLTGAYEPATLATVTDVLQSGDVVLDVGSNIGAFAIPVASKLRQLGGGRVIALEPSEETEARLRHHVALNRLEDVIECHQVGLSARRGTIELRDNPAFGAHDAGTATTLGDGAIRGTIEVDRGDDWLAANGIAAVHGMKIDVEGAEEQVLEGLEGLFPERAPRWIVIELVQHAFVPDGHVERLVDRLARWGYRGEQISASGLRALDPGRGHVGNALFRKH